MKTLSIALEAALVFLALQLAVWAIATKPAWRQIGDAGLLVACGIGAACVFLLIAAMFQNTFMTYAALIGFSFLIARVDQTLDQI